MQIGAATVESGMEFPQNLKKELPYDPEILLLEIYLKKPKTLIWKNMCTPMFISTLFTMAKIWKQPKCPPVDEWIKQLVCLHNGILLGHKKEENVTLWDSMDGPEEHYAKWN